MRKIIFIVFGIAAIITLIVLSGPEQVMWAFSRIRPESLLTLFSLQLATLAASSWIWHFLLNKKASISYPAVFTINQAASLVESLTPSVKLGGEAAKIYLFRKQARQSYEEVTGTLLIHKFLTMSPFVLLCLLISIPGLYLSDIPISFHVPMGISVVLCIGLGIICYKQPGSISRTLQSKNNTPKFNFLTIITNGHLKNFVHRSASFINQARTSASTLLSLRETLILLSVSMGIWFLYPVKVYLASIFLGYEVSFMIIALATLFAYMISMLPLLPGGLGTYEGGMTALLTFGGLSPAEGLSVALLTRLTTFWFPLGLSALCSLALFRQDNLFKKNPADDRSVQLVPQGQ